MQNAPLFFLDLPFEERLTYITDMYGRYNQDELVNSVLRIQKRLGGLDTKNAVNYLVEKEYKEAFRILLTYYDKYYERSLHKEDIPRNITTVVCEHVDIRTNSNKLIAKKQLTNGITNRSN
jgi:tRNA 2-selenouridine synthase